MHSTFFKRLLPVLACCMALSGSLPAQGADPGAPPKAVIAAGSTPYNQAVARYRDRKSFKVVGGKPARIADYPWQVSLGVAGIPDPYYAHVCGGSIYAARWIVTAAHCVRATAAGDIVVTAGTDKLGQGGTRANVKRVFINPRFIAATLDSDIALMELAAPLPLGAAMMPVDLMTPAEETAWLSAVQALATVGWGATEEGGRPVRNLRHVLVGYVPPKDCNGALSYDGKITGNMLCAGNLAGGQDACQGDSGGPLSTAVQGRTRLAGIVSWGEGCANPGQVGVYTRVANFANWAAACVANASGCN
jgi:secreted trypsin-like serine protease